jgi:hypothetical protein
LGRRPRLDIVEHVFKALLRRFEIVADLLSRYTSGAPPVSRANRNAISAVTAAVPFSML